MDEAKEFWIWLLDNVQLGNLGQWVESAGSLGVLFLTYRLLRSEHRSRAEENARTLAKLGPTDVSVSPVYQVSGPTWVLANGASSPITDVRFEIDATKLKPDTTIRISKQDTFVSVPPKTSVELAASNWKAIVTAETMHQVAWVALFDCSGQMWQIRSDRPEPELIGEARSGA